MARRQDLSGFDDAERFNLRRQMRNRSKLRLFAGSCAIVSLVLVTYVTTEAWFASGWTGKGEGLGEMDELSHMAGSSLKGLHTARDMISANKYGREKEELLDMVDRIGAIAQDGTPNDEPSLKRPRTTGPKVDTKSVQFSVHVVVEHPTGLDMLMVRGREGGEWGPVTGTAVTTRVIRRGPRRRSRRYPLEREEGRRDRRPGRAQGCRGCAHRPDGPGPTPGD